MKYSTTVEILERLKISSRRIEVLCAEGKMDGFIKKGKTWVEAY